MKLEFVDVTIKNFFSVGSKPIKLTYEPGINAVMGRVVGQSTNNGVGKSTILVDSVVFALYGKSIRKVNKNKLINSINKRDCYVHLRFKIDGHMYRIERGLNPDYLKLIDEENEEDDKEKSDKKSTQKDIDDLINLSFESFKNIVTLNINFSNSFFKMTAAQRRDILETLLNYSLYGRMFELAKKQNNSYKKEFNLLTQEVKLLINAYQEKVQTFKKIESIKKDFENKKSSEINDLTNELSEKEKELSEIVITDKNYDDIIEKITEKINELSIKFNSLKERNNDLEIKIRSNNKKIKELTSNPVCSICNTPTDSEHTVLHIQEITEENKTCNEKIENNEKTKDKIKNKIKELTTKKELAKKHKIQKDDLQNKSNDIEKTIKRLKKDIDVTKSKSLDLEIIDKKDLLKEKSKISKKKDYIKEVKHKLDLSDEMKNILGDGGVKNYAIKKMLVSINKTMNEILSILNAHYTITFDSDLNETLKSRNRDVFTYENFSSGEQKRIDLAWIFTALAIAKMRNTVNCNLLVLDEVLDSSMCSNGINMLMYHLKTKFKSENPDLCIYIITHKSEISEDDFDSVIKLKKENSFTKLEDVEHYEPVLQV